ncbi:hypothetical protein D3C87_2075730 [compost metagenome]
MPMSRMKCWLNDPVVVTPGTAKYQPWGEASMKTPLAMAATPSTTARLIQVDFNMGISFRGR